MTINTQLLRGVLKKSGEQNKYTFLINTYIFSCKFHFNCILYFLGVLKYKYYFLSKYSTSVHLCKAFMKILLNTIC